MRFMLESCFDIDLFLRIMFIGAADYGLDDIDLVFCSDPENDRFLALTAVEGRVDGYTD